MKSSNVVHAVTHNGIAPKSPFMDCGDPSCYDKQEMFKMATEAVSSDECFVESQAEKAVKQPAAFTQKESEFTVRDAKGRIHECPPTRELLGRHSWTLVVDGFVSDV